MHNLPGLELGKFATRAGPIMQRHPAKRLRDESNHRHADFQFYQLSYVSAATIPAEKVVVISE